MRIEGRCVSAVRYGSEVSLHIRAKGWGKPGALEHKPVVLYPADEDPSTEQPKRVEEMTDAEIDEELAKQFQRRGWAPPAMEYEAGTWLVYRTDEYEEVACERDNLQARRAAVRKLREEASSCCH